MGRFCGDERDFVKTRPGLIFHISGDNKMSNHKGQMPWNLHTYFTSNCYKSKENPCAELQVFFPVISFSSVLWTYLQKNNVVPEQVERYTPVQGGSWKIEKAVGMRYLFFLCWWLGSHERIYGRAPNGIYLPTWMNRLVFVVMWIDIPYTLILWRSRHTWILWGSQDSDNTNSWPDCIIRHASMWVI